MTIAEAILLVIKNKEHGVTTNNGVQIYWDYANPDLNRYEVYEPMQDNPSTTFTDPQVAVDYFLKITAEEIDLGLPGPLD